MDDLVAWLRAVLDEDEQAALRLRLDQGGRWTSVHDADGPGHAIRTVRDTRVARYMDAAVAGHIVLHDPAAVLADIEAKRAILEQADRAVTAMRTAMNPGNAGAYAAWQTAVRLLGEAYAHRPGYRDEWRP